MTNGNHIVNFQNNYFNKGTAYIDKNLSPFDEKDLMEISQYCEKVEKEFITVGDANEVNYVNVGRFMTDIEKPELAANEYSSPMLSIINSKKVINFVKKVMKINDDLYIRRVQFNEISKNCFVGYHLDIDSNPDYIAACVLQLGQNFKGGLYRVYNKNEKKNFIDYKPEYGSLIISDCQYPHEVTKVTEGNRGSLVFFVSKNKGANKRYS